MGKGGSKGKRVAIYLRVSTSEQTTDNQRRELEAVAANSIPASNIALFITELQLAQRRSSYGSPACASLECSFRQHAS
jgi:hypothetical protein